MVMRSFWLRRIQAAWKRRSVVWLSGVRRAGKTVLAKSLPGIEYLDCELPSVRHMLEDVETFLHGTRGKTLVFDEIQRLANPSELLKIAADHYPGTRVLATGSSTLQASSKFRDTLTGRKIDIWLTPMMSIDLTDFQQPAVPHRLQTGGLPPFFLHPRANAGDFQEWLDSYWARDIQELFRLEKRWSFQRFIELVLHHSGGIFEAQAYAGPCEISRPTVTNYLAVAEATRLAHIIRPYSRRATAEITAAPKVYGFDTGFIRHFRGWETLRPDDLGLLWEHLVLNEMQSHGVQKIQYWRDKQGHELDFVLPRSPANVIAIECKWQAERWDAGALRIFRRHYPRGHNWVVAHNVRRPYARTIDELSIEFLGLDELARRCGSAKGA